MTAALCPQASTSSAARLCSSRNTRRALVCRAAQVSAPAPMAALTPLAARGRGSMIRNLAAAVELDGHVQRYETFAGRSAMVGVAVAAAIELLTDQAVFFSTGISSESALGYAAVAAGTLTSAVCIALARSSDEGAVQGGSDLVESVYASLTAVRRSAASVTQTQVDKAVDNLMETVLEDRFDSYSIEALLSTDDEA